MLLDQNDIIIYPNDKNVYVIKSITHIYVKDGDNYLFEKFMGININDYIGAIITANIITNLKPLTLAEKEVKLHHCVLFRETCAVKISLEDLCQIN